MNDLEKYINEDTSLPPLIKAGLAHVQFEIIHPFLDGNGRIGRLLIILILINNRLLNEPIIYPSYYFKKNSAEYYLRLDQVRTRGNFEEWIIFYLTAIRDSSIEACNRIKVIEAQEAKIKTWLFPFNCVNFLP
jgi:Fic family protein